MLWSLARQARGIYVISSFGCRLPPRESSCPGEGNLRKVIIIKKKLDFSYDLLLLRHFNRYGVKVEIEDRLPCGEYLVKKGKEKFPHFDPEKDPLYFVTDGEEVVLAISDPTAPEFGIILKTALLD